MSFTTTIPGAYVKGTLREYVEVSVPDEHRAAVLAELGKAGFHITRSGPVQLTPTRVDNSRFEAHGYRPRIVR